MNDSSLEQTFSRLFRHLASAGYAWQPLEPARLQAARARDREGAEILPALLRSFGLGLGFDALITEGFSPAFLAELTALRPGVARVGDHYVAYRLPNTSEGKATTAEPVYLGPESARLAALLCERGDALHGKAVLELGSGAGALTLVLAELAERVLAIELSERAVAWAEASARAQGIANAHFVQGRIGKPSADAAAAGGPWDAVVFNPPLAVPSAEPGSARPERDGGHLGIEIPLLFLDFSWRHLRPGGEVLFFVASPILTDGSTPFFDRAAARGWEWLERKRMHGDFNRALFRRDGYAQLRIQRIELWFLRGRKPTPTS